MCVIREREKLWRETWGGGETCGIKVAAGNWCGFEYCFPRKLVLSLFDISCLASLTQSSPYAIARSSLFNCELGITSFTRCDDFAGFIPRSDPRFSWI